MTGKCGKNQRKNYFSTILVFDSKTRSQIRSARKKNREKSLVIKSEGFFGLVEGENAERGEMHFIVQN